MMGRYVTVHEPLLDDTTVEFRLAPSEDLMSRVWLQAKRRAEDNWLTLGAFGKDLTLFQRSSLYPDQWRSLGLAYDSANKMVVS